MPSMAKVNNRVINYRDFSFSLRNNFINEYPVCPLFYYFRFEEKFCHAITIPGREIEVWPELPFHKWGRRREIRTWIPPRDPIKWKRENNGGLTSDLYLQNNAVSFFFRFVVLSFRQRGDKGLDVRFFFWSQQADVYLSPVALLVALPLTSVHLLCHEE